MKLDIKLNEYKKNIESLKAIESLEVYRWLISLGEKLNNDPLSKERRTIKNILLKGYFSSILRLINDLYVRFSLESSSKLKY